ncbi:hypothetical protein [Capybara microvirus Cap1_SP_115]|nr:hypothetical protein [Capybara microvirus Cap1_SP_115]
MANKNEIVVDSSKLSSNNPFLSDVQQINGARLSGFDTVGDRAANLYGSALEFESQIALTEYERQYNQYAANAHKQAIAGYNPAFNMDGNSPGIASGINTQMPNEQVARSQIASNYGSLINQTIGQVGAIVSSFYQINNLQAQNDNLVAQNGLIDAQTNGLLYSSLGQGISNTRAEWDQFRAIDDYAKDFLFTLPERSLDELFKDGWDNLNSKKAAVLPEYFTNLLQDVGLSIPEKFRDQFYDSFVHHITGIQNVTEYYNKKSAYYTAKQNAFATKASQDDIYNAILWSNKLRSDIIYNDAVQAEIDKGFREYLKAQGYGDLKAQQTIAESEAAIANANYNQAMDSKRFNNAEDLFEFEYTEAEVNAFKDYMVSYVHQAIAKSDMTTSQKVALFMAYDQGTAIFTDFAKLFFNARKAKTGPGSNPSPARPPQSPSKVVTKYY